MRFVSVKSQEQQSVLMVHRARELALANRTAQVNQIRGLLAEFGVVVPQRVARLRHALPRSLEDAENGVPMIARQVLVSLLDQLHTVDEQMAGFDRQIRQIAEASESAQRLLNNWGNRPTDCHRTGGYHG